MSKIVPKGFVAFHLTILMILFFVPQTGAKIIYVGPSEAYDNIMWGLTVADPGDTVMVRDGIYVQDIKIREGVVLMAENKHKAVIGDGSDTRALISIRQESLDGAVIDGFKFDAGNYPAIFVGDMNEEDIRNCTIKNNLIEGRKSGITVSPYSVHTTISENTIRGCETNAILIQGLGNNIVTDNVVEDCGLWGIFLAEQHDSNILIRGNTIRNNQGGGIGIEKSNVTVEKNLIEGNLIGIGTNCGKTGITVRDSNQVINNIEQGIIIECFSQANITDNIISGNGMEGLRLIGNSTVQRNIIERNGYWGIFMPAGSHHIEDNIIAYNEDQGVEIGYESESTQVINNTISDNRNSGIRLEHGAIIQGNLIRANGEHGIYLSEYCHNAEITKQNTIKNNLGWEVAVDSGSSVLIRDNIIEDDTVNLEYQFKLSGIYIRGSARVEGNLIQKMNSGAIYISEGAGNVEVTGGNTIQNNKHGIIVCSSARIDDNILSHNNGFGILVRPEAMNVKLTKNKLHHNHTGIAFSHVISGLQIERNNISENLMGIIAEGEALLRSNTVIWNDSCGIQIQESGIDLGTVADSGKNAILENGFWNIRNETEDQIDAYYNFWGFTDADSIDATIWDDEEESQTGPILFDPFLNDLNVGVASPIVPGTGSGSLEYLEAFPNPFKHRVMIRYRLKVPQKICLKILDTSGRITKTLIPGMVQTPGEYQHMWDGYTDQSTTAREGHYLIVIQAGNEVKAQKVLLLK